MIRHRMRPRRHIVLPIWLFVGLSIIGTCQAVETNESRDDTAATSARVVDNEPDADESFGSLGVNTIKAGSSSISVRKQGISELPLDRLSNEARSKTESLLKNLGMFRRLPTLSFEADPEVYDYFLKNPDVAVATWRAMDISKFKLQNSGLNCYRADAGDGSVGLVELFYQSTNDTLIHCDGAFKSPLLQRPIIARSLMRLQATFAREPDGRIIGTHSGDVFVEFPSPAIETLAKVISPLSHTIADRNFKQMTLFAHLMSQAMARHPGWIESIGNKLEGIESARILEFLKVSARSHVMARHRMNANTRPTVSFSPEDVTSPFRERTVSTALSLPVLNESPVDLSIDRN